LTEDEIVLGHHINVLRSHDQKIVHMAYINAYHHESGTKNGIDTAILLGASSDEKDITLNEKVGEIPFNFENSTVRLYRPGTNWATETNLQRSIRRSVVSMPPHSLG